MQQYLGVGSSFGFRQFINLIKLDISGIYFCSELSEDDNFIRVVAVIPHLWYLVNLCLLAEVTLDQISVSELTKDDNLVRIWVMVPPRHDASDWDLDSYSLGVILSGRSPV